MAAKHRVRFLSCVLSAIFPLLAAAATIEFRTLIDVDNSAATGCAAGGMTGVDHIVVTLVKTDATSGAVDKSYRLVCSGTSFGSPIDMDTSGWPVGFNASSGGMLVENRIAFSVLGSGMPSGIRLGFGATTGGSVHAASANPNGSAVIYPNSPGRRRSVASGGNAALNFQLDGDGSDWGNLSPILNGIAGGGSTAIRMLKAYAFANPSDEFLYFRVDANAGSDAPFAEDDDYSRAAGENLSVPAPGVLANDGDPNGQPVTALPVSAAANGDVTLNPDGSFTYTPDDPTSSQTDSFQYKATNGAQESNVAKVTIKVSSIANNAPIALNDSHTTGEDQTLNIGVPGVIGNDSDPDGDTLTVTKLTDPANGSVVVNNDGSFTYSPDLDFFGTDTFTYSVTDGELTATATVTITVTSVNDAPTVATASFAVDENSPNGTVVGPVSASDVEVSDSHTYAITGGNTGGVFAISNTGQITVADNSGLNFEAVSSFNLTVTVTDNGVPAASGSATVTITVGDINEAPVAVNDAATVAEDGNVNVVAPGLLANDTDQEGNTLTATKLTDPANGVATVAANGGWTYTPTANFNGTDSFTYQVSDGPNTSNIATMTITVTPVNDTPSFTAGPNVTVAEDTVHNASWATAVSAGPANESGQTLTFNFSNNNNGLFSVQPAISPAGVLTFTPAANANGSANVTVSVSDNGGGADTSAAVNFTITVTEVNDPPVATNDAQTTPEDITLVIAVATLATNDSAGPANESAQTRTVTGVSATSAQGGTVTLVAGTITYTPAANYNGPDSFTYTVTDNGTTNGAADPQSAVGTVNVTVTEVNDAPAANPDVANASEDTPLILGAATLTTNDSAGPANESAQTMTVTAVSPASAQGGTVTLVAGNITYTPPANYFGTDSFTYTVTDNGTTNGVAAPMTANGTVNLTVTPVNDAPLLTVAGAVTHTEGGAATNVATAVNITDVDDTNIESATIRITGNWAPTDDVLTFVNTPQITGVLIGDTLTLTGSDTRTNYIAALQAVQYTNTSNAPSTLQRTITWTVNDGDANSNIQTTTLDVIATNDGPQNTVPGAQTVGEDTPLTFSTANANAIAIADADANPDDVQVTLNVTNGTVTLNGAATAPLTTLTGDGTGTVVATGTVAEINAALNGLSFTSIGNYSGPASIQIVTNDLGNNPSGALTDTDSVIITVTPVNDATALTVNGAVTHAEAGAATNLATVANITDVDDTNIESATIQITGNYAGAQDVLSFVNTPQITGSFVGDTLTLTGSDTEANYIAALQAVQYTNTSDAPSVLQRTITWTVNDGNNNSNIQTTTLDITATNDAPVNTVAVGASTNEDTPLVINGASIADADAASDDVQIILNVTGGTVTLDATATGALTSLTGDGTATVTATGTVAEINAALGGMTFNPTADSSGTASIQMVTDDLGNNPSGNLADTDSFNITVNTGNDAPALTVTGSPTFVENGPAVPIASAVNITDVDDTNIESATITITNTGTGDTLNFVNTPNITGVFAAGVLTLTGSDTEAAYIAALQSITYSNALDNPSITQRAITWVVNDGDTNSNIQNTTLDVSATNDGPQNTVPAGLATNEDVPLVINGASISDADADPDDVQITLNVTNGTVTLDPTATGALATLTNDGTASVVATGTVAEINAALSGMTFTPTAEFSGTGSIQMVTDDLGNNPSGALQDDDTFNITVTNINDAPVLTVTGPPTFAENGSAVAIAASANITDIDDTDVNTATITITNFQTGDVLNFTNTVDISGSYNGAGVLTLTGPDTKGSFAAALQTITFSNASDNPSITQRTITWAVNDGDVNSNTQNTTVDVTATNDGPVNTVPAGLATNEDTPLVINGAFTSDADADPDDVEVTLTVTSGTVTTDPTATGLTSLTGNGTASVVITGTVAEVNDALIGMTFTPDADFSGTASINLSTNDLGNNPSGAITVADAFNITVNGVNDAPTLAVTGSPTFNENGAAVNIGTSVNITDPDDANIESASISITTNFVVGDDVVFVNQLGISGSYTSGTGVLLLSGSATKADYITALGSITFTTTGENPSPLTRSITWTVNDGTDGSNAPITTVGVNAINDPPVLSNPASVNATEDLQFSFTGGDTISVTDVDSGAGTNFQASLSSNVGTQINVTAAGTANVSGNNTNSVQITGTVADVNATLATTKYQPNVNSNGSSADVMNVTVTDNGQTGSGPAGSSSPNIPINIAAVNDAPSFSIPGDPPFIVLGAGAQTVNGYATSINDGDPELTQVLTFNLSQTGNTGTLAFDVAPAIDSSTGNLTYTPTAGTHGTVTFSVTLSDNGATGGANVNVSGAQSFIIAVEKAPEVTTTTPANGDTGVSTSTNITVNFDEPVSVTLVPPSFKINCNAGPDLAFAYIGSTTNVTSVVLDPTGTLPAGDCVVTVLKDEVHDTDANDLPDGLAADYVFSFVTNTPPTAVDDSNTALGNVTLTVNQANGVLSNDTDPDAGATLTVDLTFGTGNPYSTSAGGTVTFAADGSYTYQSQAGEQDVVADTVTYRVKDQFGGTDTGVLTINLGPRVIYVDDVGVAGDGRDTSPFQSISLAQTGGGQTQALAGDTILVKSGNYTDAVTLKNTQIVFGQGITGNHTITHNAVVFTVLTGGGAGAAPALNTTAGDAITLAANNTIRGLAISPAAGRGVFGNAFTAVTINESSINATGGSALNLTTGAATIALTNTSSTNAPTQGVNLNAVTGSVALGGGAISGSTLSGFFVNAGTAVITYGGNISSGSNTAVTIQSHTTGNITLSGTITGTTGGISVTNKTSGTVAFSGAQNLSTGGNPGVSLNTNNGSTIAFSGTGLAITTSTGAAFNASGGGTLSVTGTTNTISVTGAGSGLTLNGMTIASGNNITFNTITTAATSTTGVSLTALLGTGSVVVNGGTNSAVTGVALNNVGTIGTTLSACTINGQTGITGVAGFGTLTINNVTLSTANQAMSLTTGTLNGTFTSVANSGNGNVTGVFLSGVGGSFTVSAGTITDAGTANTVFNVVGGNATITWNGAMTQNQAAAVIDITGHSAGTITFGGTVTATAGSGLQFSNADGSYQFTGAAVLSGGAGIDILAGSDATNGSQGTFTWDSDSSIGNTTGQLVDVQGSKPTVTYSGTFTKTNTGIGINATNNTGGSILFNGTGAQSIDSGASNAVNLVNNDGCTITFSGGNLTLVTSSGVGFHASQGGTVSVTGANNTINTTAGSALQVLGSSGEHMAGAYVFRSIASANGVKGISVQFHDGAFSVTGDGADGDTLPDSVTAGGTITGADQRGAEFIDVDGPVSLAGMTFTNSADTAGPDATVATGTCGSGASGGSNTGCYAGLHYDTVSNVTIHTVNVTGSGQMGINGNAITNLTMQTVNVTNAGTSAQEEGIRMYNLGGTGSMTAVTIDNPFGMGLHLQNTNVTLASEASPFLITNAVITDSTVAQGAVFHTVSSGTAYVKFVNGTISGHFSVGIQTASDVGASGTLGVYVDNTSFSNVAGAIHLQAGGGTHKFDIRNIDMVARASGSSHSIMLKADSAGVLTGKVYSNTIGNAGAYSGAPSGSYPISVDARNTSEITAEIRGNTFRHADAGVEVGGGQGSSKVELTVTGNYILDPEAATALAGIYANSGILNSDSSCMTMQIGGLTAYPGSPTATESEIQNRIEGAWPSGSVRVIKSFGGSPPDPVFNLPLYNGTGVNAWITARNSIGGSAVTSNAGAGGAFTGGVSCP